MPQDPPDTMKDEDLVVTMLYNDLSHGEVVEYHLLLDARGQDSYERFIKERLAP